MSIATDLINFDLIEEQKENIQQLPGGRSARQLASVLSPLPSTGKAFTHEDTKTLNDALRHEYELELQGIDDADDPLDIYVRYVRWTLQAYPSAQSTPQSQLCPLLERATKHFLSNNDYKNDPRYLKLWLQYVRLFSDAPRETFAFLARHNIAEHLALFYEEFAAWLEINERWTQADEVFRMGIEKEARPTERLMRKYAQFKARFDARSVNDEDPKSPALKIRKALGSKLDPFAHNTSGEQPQQLVQPAQSANKPKKAKMQIFSDAGNAARPSTSSLMAGWDTIDSIKNRKKENSVEAQPWAGQVLKQAKKAGSAPKMDVFKDSNIRSRPRKFVVLRKDVARNPNTGRLEQVAVNMELIYCANEENSFEELIAKRRGWCGKTWRYNNFTATQDILEDRPSPSQMHRKPTEERTRHDASLTVDSTTPESCSQSQISQPQLGSPHDQHTGVNPRRQKKLKHLEVKEETQTIKTQLNSPSKPRIRRKVSAEPTMTMNSKIAQNQIYEMFNNTQDNLGLSQERDDAQSGQDTDFEADDTFSTTGENTQHTSHGPSMSSSEFGDDTSRSLCLDIEDQTSSDLNTGKLAKMLKKASRSIDDKYSSNASEELTTDELADKDEDGRDNAFDTQAINAIANADFSDLDTVAIARLAGEESRYREEADAQSTNNDSITPTEQSQLHFREVAETPRYVPLPPENYEPALLRPYRDQGHIAQNRLPFMTPIVEQTESSLAAGTIYQRQFLSTTKTPSRSEHNSAYSSPSKDLAKLLIDSPKSGCSSRKRSVDLDDREKNKDSPPKKQALEVDDENIIPFPIFTSKNTTAPTTAPSGPKPPESSEVFDIPTGRVRRQSHTSSDRPVQKGPIITDLQVNPCSSDVINTILSTVHPQPFSYPGYNSDFSANFNRFTSIRAFAKQISKLTTKVSPRKSGHPSNKTQPVAPSLQLAGSSKVYVIKRELGEGAFAPVYLAESHPTTVSQDDTDSCELVAIKAEPAQGTHQTLQWEFYILKLLNCRLGSTSSTIASIIQAISLHLYRDESYLVLSYHPQGTLLDLVNAIRYENIKAGKIAEGLDEPVAVFLTVELLKVVEDIHRAGVLHGDLKADNVLVRFDTSDELRSPYCRHGDGGWSAWGITLIDFGRGIDTRAFRTEARFIAEWAASPQDCPEIRETRSWKHEIDYFGLAGVVHSILFGKYIETVPLASGSIGPRREVKLREGFKRYWERDLWAELFAILMNSGGKTEVEARKAMGDARERMQTWLEEEAEKGGRDLRSGLKRCGRIVGARGNGGRERR